MNHPFRMRSNWGVTDRLPHTVTNTSDALFTSPGTRLLAFDAQRDHLAIGGEADGHTAGLGSIYGGRCRAERSVRSIGHEDVGEAVGVARWCSGRRCS